MRAIDPIGPLGRDVAGVEPIPRRAPDGRRERRRDDEPDREGRPAPPEDRPPDADAAGRSDTEPPGDGLHVDVRA
jgi:hypothetical protein